MPDVLDLGRQVIPMMRYAVMCRLGLTPWERYKKIAAVSTGALLDREEAGRSRPLGRAIDLGCGGQWVSTSAGSLMIGLTQR